MNTFEIIGYTDLKDQGLIFNVKYLGNDNKLKKLNSEINNFNVVLAVGSDKENNNIGIRKRLIKIIKTNKFKTPNIISPNSYVDKLSIIKEGSIIFDGSFIDFNSEIGSFSVVNLNTLVCHDSKISENVILSPNCLILGKCKIEENVFVGASATINPGIKVSKNCVIGSGSLVNKNCIMNNTYVGNPAKISSKSK